ncbi:hypothetical protein V7S43_003188 [Phytophthora oleae]|uniref:Uncharacterized protein n=1 Tax=Phytophthora oleae TaxID=2107226 RepID=A0ABD3FXW6_9STRA
MLTFVFAAAFAAAWFQTKHYLLNNFFGISLSIKAIKSLSLGSFKVGSILLCGLFFYDIFWHGRHGHGGHVLQRPHLAHFPAGIRDGD